jgi:hypothetical protein
MPVVFPGTPRTQVRDLLRPPAATVVRRYPEGLGGCNGMSRPGASHGEMSGFLFPGRPRTVWAGSPSPGTCQSSSAW